jgi:N-acetylglucosaminyl-diphospho-decaprenol L-rhamnosyltransferase
MNMNDTAKINVIVVNYRTADLTIRCVKSIIDKGVASVDNIVVVDNFSQDNSLDVIRAALPERVALVASNRNAGFGAGVNKGFDNTNSDYLLILNPDTYFEFDSVSPVISYMEANKDVGLVGLDLVNPDGSRQYSARRFYSMLDVFARRIKRVGSVLRKRVDRHLMREAWNSDAPFDADWVMGTGFIIRSSLYKKLNGMDESYFLYMEDVDLCARVWRAGQRVKCFPGAQLVHDHQRSSAAGPLTFAGRTHIRSLLLFRRRFTLPLVKSPGVNKIISC